MAKKLKGIISLIIIIVLVFSFFTLTFSIGIVGSPYVMLLNKNGNIENIYPPNFYSKDQLKNFYTSFYKSIKMKRDNNISIKFNYKIILSVPSGTPQFPICW